MKDNIIAKLRLKLPVSVIFRELVPACEVTSFKLGGVLSYLVKPLSLTDLISTIELLNYYELDWRVLGAGSNLLVQDSGYQGVVIVLGKCFTQSCLLSGQINNEELGIAARILCSNASSEAEGEVLQFNFEEFDNIKLGEQIRVLVGGAIQLMGLSRRLSQGVSSQANFSRGNFSGLEFAAGIPASFGGAVKMNAGAHGKSISQVISRLVILKKNGDLEIVDNDSLLFSYRRSAIADTDIVIGTEIILTKVEEAVTLNLRKEALDFRKNTQPLNYPSAGSVFLNPGYGHLSSNTSNHLSAAALLEKSGLKGFRIGGAAYSDKHANWIIKVASDASASDVLSLMKEGKDRVLRNFGISLVSEIKIW